MLLMNSVLILLLLGYLDFISAAEKLAEGKFEVLKTRIGEPLQISYSSSSTSRLIQYCMWTPPSQNKSNAVPFLTTYPLSKCGVTLEKVKETDFGNWKYIALINNNEDVVEGLVKVVHFEERRSNKTKIFILQDQDQDGVLELTEKEINVTCCTENFPVLRILQVYLGTDELRLRPSYFTNNFSNTHCFTWKQKFSYLDNRKQLICKASSFNLVEETKVFLNINYAPKIVSNNGSACGMTTIVKYPEKMYIIQFVSNPPAVANLKRIVPTIVDRKYSYEEVTSLNSSHVTSELQETKRNGQSVMEYVIHFRNISSDLVTDHNLKLLLRLVNIIGECKIYLNVAPSKSTPTIQVSTTTFRPNYKNASVTTKRTDLNPQLGNPISKWSDVHNQLQPVILGNKNLKFVENTTTQITCCVPYQPGIDLNFQLENGQKIMSNKTMNIYNGTDICLQFKFDVDKRLNEKLLRCRSTLYGYNTNSEDSILVFVPHKPYLLESWIRKNISTYEFIQDMTVSVLISANPKPNVIWQVRNMENQLCFFIKGDFEKLQKDSYNATLKLSPTIEMRITCGNAVKISLDLTNEYGKNEEVEFQWNILPLNTTNGASCISKIHRILFLLSFFAIRMS